MKFAPILVIALVPFFAPAQAGTFVCKTMDGTHKPVGQPKLQPAAARDATVLGSVFHVQRDTGQVVGPALFRNENQKVEILRSTDTAYELVSRNQHSDVALLKIEEFEKKWTFKYYAGWLGLLVTGECIYS